MTAQFEKQLSELALIQEEVEASAEGWRREYRNQREAHGPESHFALGAYAKFREVSAKAAAVKAASEALMEVGP